LGEKKGKGEREGDWDMKVVVTTRKGHVDVRYIEADVFAESARAPSISISYTHRHHPETMRALFVV
jgi:hypothetical protein